MPSGGVDRFKNLRAKMHAETLELLRGNMGDAERDGFKMEIPPDVARKVAYLMMMMLKPHRLVVIDAIEHYYNATLAEQAEARFVQR